MLCLITDHNTFTAEPRSDASNPVLCAMIDSMYWIHWNSRIDSNPKFFIDEETLESLEVEAERNDQYFGDALLRQFMGVPVYIVQLGTKP